MFWALVSMGIVVCYATSSLRGGESGGPYLFVAAMAVWCTGVALLMVASQSTFNRVRQLLTARWLRAAGWSLYGLVMCPLVAEVGLRGYELVEGEAAPARWMLSRARLSPGLQLSGRTVNAQGYWDKEFSREPQPGKFRIAALGGELILGGTHESNLLAQLELAHPQVEVYNFASPATEPADYAALVTHEIADYRPDLVLAFVSVGRDIAQTSARPGWFDLDSLHTYQLGWSWWGTPPSVLEPTFAANHDSDPQAGLNRLSGQLAVCRTPIDERMRGRWQATFAALDRLVLACRTRQMELAIVVSPAEFQVNRTLLNTLARRAGYANDELDTSLPQRRLSEFGQSRNVTVIDLLPSLESSRQAPFDRQLAGYSEHGHALAAETIGHWVASQHRGWSEATAQARAR